MTPWTGWLGGKGLSGTDSAYRPRESDLLLCVWYVSAMWRGWKEKFPQSPKGSGVFSAKSACLCSGEEFGTDGE